MEKPNTNYIQQLANGNKEFENKIISVIKKEFPEEKEAYLANFNAENFLAAAENVHKFKNKISMLGLKEGYVLATNFEQELKSLKNKLHPEFLRLLNLMEAYILKL